MDPQLLKYCITKENVSEVRADHDDGEVDLGWNLVDCDALSEEMTVYNSFIDDFTKKYLRKLFKIFISSARVFFRDDNTKTYL